MKSARQTEGWTTEKLGDLFKPVSVRAKDLKADAEVIPVLSMTRAHGLVQQTDKFDKRVASRDVAQYKVASRGNLVYGFPIDEGVIAILHRFPKGLVSPAYQVLRPIKEFDDEFIDQFLRTPELVAKYTSLSSSVVERRRNLAVRDFRKIEVSLPPVAEQRKIAAILSLVRRGVQLHDRLVDLTTDLKRSLTHKLFREGLKGEEQKQTEMGLIPATWSIANLGDVCKLSTGTTPATDREDYYAGDIPFVKTAEIANNRINTATTFVSQQAMDDYGLKLHPAGTVLMAMYGQGKTRGQVGILEIAAAITQNAAAIRPSDEIDPEFLWQSLMGRYEELRGAGALGQISHLNLGYLRKLHISKPPLSVQRTIAETLGRVDDHRNLISAKRDTLQELFVALGHQLMTGSIRVHQLILPELKSLVAA